MINYDKEHIPDSVYKKARAIFSEPDFSMDAIKNASDALVGICKWAEAMCSYYDLLKQVNPKRAKVAEMTVMLEKVQVELTIKRKMLADV